MSYVDGIIDRGRDMIEIVERVDGKRQYIHYPAQYVMYYPDPAGKHTSIWGDKLQQVITRSGKTFNREKKLHSDKQLFESDINPVFRCIEDNYLNAEAPDLHIGFFDIEVDFNKQYGFAPPDDPFNPVTAIALHLSWLQKTICLVCKPSTLTTEHAQTIVEKFPDTLLMDSEEELLMTFLDLIDDVDVMSGWNSEGFDIPYLVNRISRIIGKDYTRKFCLWNMLPRRREFEKYGKKAETFDTVGRVHLDYLELYRKYTYHEMHSYSLDAIGEYELGEKKIEYEGTLDQLYNNDFELFIAYNRQDVDLLVNIDKQLQFISLANLIAHSNCVLLQTTMGAVAQTEQAIVVEAHARGMKVPDKRSHDNDHPAAGAYVATPVKGYHDDIGSIDLNSLYPSILRAGNMSTETIVGQIRHTLTDKMLQQFIDDGKPSPIARAWEGKFACPEYDLVIARDRDQMLTIDFHNGESFEASGSELYELIFNGGQDWILSANGTIFRHDVEGIIPGLLERWYAERKELQKKAKGFKGVDDEQHAFWDKRQLVKKINLNSLYGALLNAGCRFYDPRLGQSTTLTGRCIARHMAAKVNEVIAGEYDHTGKAIIYGDTDSAYFSATPILKDQIDKGEINWDKDTIIKFYDAVCEEVDGSFTGYMSKAHNCPERFGKIIAAGREIVGVSGIFITKKRYAILVYDDEGYRTDYEYNEDGSRMYDNPTKPGKIKAMGLDLKRSDTPKYMQDHLSELLLLTLTGKSEQEVIDRIIEIRKEFRDMQSWDKGTPKRVNNLTNHTAIYNKTGKCGVGHAKAAINYNKLRKMHSDSYSLEIADGMKTMVCKLKDNPMGMTSIGIPTDEHRIPQWFKELPFDDEAMEHAIITKKVKNLLGVMKWDLDSALDNTTFTSLFSFD